MILSILASAPFVCGVTSCAAEDGSNVSASSDPHADGGAPDANTVIAEPDAAALEACTDGRWCAVRLSLEGPQSFNAVWGSGPDDVWLVGSPDIAVHWNGTRFDISRMNSNQTLFGVWGSGPKDIWTFSTGDALWHNVTGESSASAWRRGEVMSSGGLPPWTAPVYGMAGRSSTDVWAVGPFLESLAQPTVWHCGGWSSGAPAWVPSITTPGANPWDREPSFNAVLTTASGDVWVVGEGGKTRWSSGWRGEATSWKVVDSLTSLPLHALWSAPNGEVWAVGGGGIVRRFSRQADGTISVTPVPFPTLASLRAIAGASATDLWVAGNDGTLAHWDGSVWSLVELDPKTKVTDLFGLWLSGPDDVWAVGLDAVLHKGTKLLPGMTP
ncbi:hypothetical protein AKJ09_06500 [Labilithrix luteola]|uniref:Type IV fimbrial biogenesis protein PilY1 n=1 Tax=Labilithrix luteola TaxID=1391654 RepID=A0A0K1Q2H0_9BACT|nr:hypothetical protein [Labilithrix luteola]AKU99836.1 hypothetical protein AKJ09_06500 [Labilithrix luteola]